MFSKVFLAQTYREMEQFPQQNTAYMACHFSPYSKGLSNIPPYLPKGSILLLDDSMPAQEHDTELVVRQLTELIQQFPVKAILLDFQGAKNAPCESMVDAILQDVPCPIAVTLLYAENRNCPVLIPPCPVNVPLQKHLAPWLKQGVFLEIGTECAEITVTQEKSTCTTLPFGKEKALPLTEPKLHCHYHVEVSSEKAVFTLQRTLEDLASLTEEALQLGVQGVVGLFQELNPSFTQE